MSRDMKPTLPLLEDGPSPGRSWRDVREIHTLTAALFADGTWRLTMNRTDMRSRHVVAVALGELEPDGSGPAPVETALEIGALEALARAIEDGRISAP